MISSKITDDYRAKLRFWVEHPRVVELPKIGNLPYFGHKRFRSHEEMNAWKRAYKREIARNGGVTWTK